MFLATFLLTYTREFSPIGKIHSNVTDFDRRGTKAERASDCSICPSAVLPDLKSFRAHFQSDWHLHNLRAHASGGQVLDLERFLVSESHEMALYTSSSESECPKPETPVGSPYIFFCVSGKSTTVESFKANKCIVLSRTELQDRGFDVSTLSDVRHRLSRHVDTNWVIFLIRSGRAACAVFDNSTGRILVSKCFKRYTTRRKQGGSQSSRDSSGGSRISSAGATIRRQNETHLIDDVQKLLESWRSYMSSSSLVFWNQSNTGRQCLFAASSPLKKDDERLRNMPFTTFKPSLEEVSRCYNLLSSIDEVHDLTKDQEKV